MAIKTHHVNDGLYFLGFIVEGIAVYLTIASKPNILTKIEADWLFEAGIIATVFCLMFHQFLIYRSFNQVDEITTHSRFDEIKYLYGSASAKSWFEFSIRSIITVFVAGATGKLIYLAIVLEEKMFDSEKQIRVTGQPVKFDVHIVYDNITNIYLFVCLGLCVLVVFWDLLMIFWFSKKDGYQKFYPTRDLIELFDSNSKVVFLISDLLSLGFWICIIITVFFGSSITATAMLLFSFFYFICISVRVFFLIFGKYFR